VEEKKTFGGLCFMVNDKMCIGVEKERLMVRIDSEKYDEAMERQGCKQMDFTGKVMKGFVFVDANVLKNKKELEHRVALALISIKKQNHLRRKKEIMTAVIKKDSIDFLKALSKNNNREWFNKNKEHYLKAHGNIIAFADALLIEMNKHDKIETPSGRKSLFRIYKDVRFAKDKTPYNTHWSGAFKRATKEGRGGYYFHLKPGDSYTIGGFWGPEPEDMKRIRKDIEFNYKAWQKLLATKTIIKTFWKVDG
jgi:TfoX/Sxy family transcriptional regulator of competence genes